MCACRPTFVNVQKPILEGTKMAMTHIFPPFPPHSRAQLSVRRTFLTHQSNLDSLAALDKLRALPRQAMHSSGKIQKKSKGRHARRVRFYSVRCTAAHTPRPCQHGVMCNALSDNYCPWFMSKRELGLKQRRELGCSRVKSNTVAA